MAWRGVSCERAGLELGLDEFRMRRATTGRPGSATAGGTGLGSAVKPVAKKVGAGPEAASFPAVEMVGDFEYGGGASGSGGCRR